VFVVAENRLLREALSRMLVKGGNIEVAGVYWAGPFRTEDLLKEEADIPLIAEGLTNKEIANRFCLSEQTVKNHLYRIKHKVGAGDRLGIVQVRRMQGFMV